MSVQAGIELRVSEIHSDHLLFDLMSRTEIIYLYLFSL